MNCQHFAFSYRVPYADCTLGNHVYYVRYFDIFENARGEMYRTLRVTFYQWQQQGFIFPMIEASIRYRGAARYDDLLEVQVWLQEAARIRLTFAYLIQTAAKTNLIEA